MRLMASSSTDVQPVLNGIARQAALLCDASYARILLVDGEMMRVSANYAADGKVVSSVHDVPLRRTAITGRAVLERATIHHADIRPLIDTEYPDARRNAREAGFGAVLAVPLVGNDVPLGALILWRTRTGPFAADQIALVETFADLAAIAIASVRQFRDTQEALEQQMATSEILRVISSSRTDVKPVFDAIVRSAVRLCNADHSIAARFDGEQLHHLAHYGFSAQAVKIAESMFPMRPGPENMLGRTALTRSVVNLPDMLADPDYSKDFAQAGGWRSGLGVPMMQGGELIGAIAVSRSAPGPFSGSQVALLETFAEQAVIAIENVRLFTALESRNRDLTEALERQTATSDILRVLSQSPTDVQPVFDTIASAALRLCRAASALVTRVEGHEVALVASANLTEEGAAAMREAFPMPISRMATSARAILEARVVTIHDVLKDPEYEVQGQALRAAFRSTLGVPLMREGRPIGTITVGKPEPGPFSDSQIALLETFADQAVIAIENVRLFKTLELRNRDLTEALEQQTATSEILRVISRSRTDVQPVFDTIAQSVHKLCGAQFANVFTYDGSLAHLAAFVRVNADYDETLRAFFPRPAGRDSAVTRAIAERRLCIIEDVLQDPDYKIAPKGGFRSIMSVPLMRDGEAVGGIAVGRPEPGPFPESQIALLQTFADQAVIAIENVRLFTELETRTAQLTRSVDELRALGEVGQAVSSTLDLGTVLSTIVARATQLTGMDGGSIFEYDEARREFHMHTSDRLPPDLVEVMRANPIRVGEGALGRMAQAGAPVEIVDLLDASSYQSPARDVLAQHGYRALLAVPLTRDNQLLGGLAVNRKVAGRFDPQVIELLKTFATQSAIAIQNARLFREIEIKSRELETASRHKSEFLANMSHELRTPLNAIIGFSEVLGERLFGEMNEKQAEYVADISESGHHLLALINDILDLSKIEAGRMELDASDVDLPKAIGHTLSLVRERAQRRNIVVGAAFEPGVGVVRADERKVKQVLLNLLSNALKFTPEGGAIDVRAAGFDDRVEVSVKDTGVGIAPGDQEAVFEEFRQVGAADKRVGGTGLGLPISRKFIELHGGRLWVASEPGKGSTFTFSLPR
jgi:GAF domain-containing protein